VVEPPDLTSLDGAAKDALILALIGRINVLIAEVETLKAENAVLRKRVADLEAELGRPPKTPDNSSMPPSRGHKASEGQSRKPKSQAHGGAHRPLHPNPTHRREVVAERCPHCRADVAGVAQSAVHAYDRIEIPEIRPEVTRVTLYGGRCACCARRFKAAPPAGLEPGSPFGPNLRAFVLYLRFTQAISFERLARLLSDLLGLEISEGALVNMLDDSRAAFARQTSLIRQRLLAGTVLQSDETSVRVGKQTWWTWVFHDADSACFLIRPSRGKAVVEEFLADHRPAFWVSDRLAAQMGWATQDHQVCLAHLLREAQYAIEAGDDAFAPAARGLLADACAIGQRRPRLADATLRAYAAKLERRLDALLRIAPRGQQGARLQRILKKVRRHLFVFVTHRALPATNNGSEQALRACVIFRKVTNGFRSEWAADLYANIRSVLETARRRAIAPLDAVRLTLQGAPLPDTG
jgi:transposase